MLALDTETTLSTRAEPVPRLVVAAIAWGPEDGDTALLHHSDPETPDVLREALQGPLTLHNAPFDFTVIGERYPELIPLIWRALETDPAAGFGSPGLVWDTGTRQRLLDLANGRGLKREYSLSAVAVVYGLAKDAQDPWRTRFGEYLNTPVSQWDPAARHYAAGDARVAFALRLGQQAAADRFAAIAGLDPLVDGARQARAHWALTLSSLHGVQTDPAAVAALDARLEAEQERCKRLLETHNLVWKKGQRNTKAAQALARDYGITDRTPSGDTCLDEETLAKLNLPEIDWSNPAAADPLAVYARYGSVMGLRSRSVQPMKDLIIRPRYTELQENGRTSAAGRKADKFTGEPKSGMNTQNLPRGDHAYERGFRECLVPSDYVPANDRHAASEDAPNVFIVGDWSKMELCTQGDTLIELFGWDAPTASLARILIEGRDPHTELGRLLNSGDPVRDRQQAKPGNFGFWGLMGTDRFIDYARAQGVILTREQATAIKRAFWQLYAPDYYFDWIRDNAQSGIVQRISGRVRAGGSQPDNANGVWSGLAADVAKDTLWVLAKDMYVDEASPAYGCRQALFQHDENVIVAPIAIADDVAAWLKARMETVFSRWCKHVPCKADVQIMTRYSKTKAYVI